MTDEEYKEFRRQLHEGTRQTMDTLHVLALRGLYPRGWTEGGKKALLDYQPEDYTDAQ